MGDKNGNIAANRNHKTRSKLYPAQLAQDLPQNIPNDVKIFYRETNGIKFFPREAYSIEIVASHQFIPINTYLFSDESTDLEL